MVIAVSVLKRYLNTLIWFEGYVGILQLQVKLKKNIQENKSCF